MRKIKSLSIRLPLILILSYIVLMVFTITVVFQRFEKRMLEDYTRMAKGATQLMADAIDGDKVDEYIEQNFASEEYRKISDYLASIQENYPDTLYVYVYRIQEDGGHVVFDIDSEGKEDADEPGAIYPIDEPFYSQISNIMKGEETPAYTVHSHEGEYLLSYIRPVFDSKGNYACSACVDFSMDRMHEKDFDFVLPTLGMVGILILILVSFNILLIHRTVSAPINRMVECSHNFNYETENDRFKNVQTLENLNIKTGDEIEELYQTFTSVMKESLYYMTNFNRAQIDIRTKNERIDEISATAYKDALTGVGSKAAYKKVLKEIDGDIFYESAEIAIVLADVNNLKYVNDTFGHEYGDAYLVGCCNLLKSVYANSDIYRVGGDEFIILLRGSDYKNREELLKKARELYQNAHANESANPWERYSSSIGMAEFETGDTNAEMIVKRADTAMYVEKTKFRAKHGSYR